MTFDNEAQRKFLLEMFKGVNFPGAVLDDSYALKQAVLKATIAPLSEAAKVSQLFDKTVGDS